MVASLPLLRHQTSCPGRAAELTQQLQIAVNLARQPPPVAAHAPPHGGRAAQFILH